VGAATTTTLIVEPAGTCATAVAAVKTMTAIKFVIARTVPSQRGRCLSGAPRQIPAKSGKWGRYTGCSVGWCKRPEYLRQGAVSCWGAGSLANTKGIA